MVTWSDPELEKALAECRLTHTGVNPCQDPQYLAARYNYHRLLVERGLLRKDLAEPLPHRVGV
jgi:hypothetical protein